MAAQEIRVPDIGDFTDVPIIEIHVAPGDTVNAEDPLLTLESDKATLDVPKETVTSQPAASVGGGAPANGAGPKEELTAPAGYGSSAGPPSGHDRTAAPVGAPTPYTGAKGDVHAEVLVLGAGPGGYTAAFRAADRGRKVVMVDSRGPLGGVSRPSIWTPCGRGRTAWSPG